MIELIIQKNDSGQRLDKFLQKAFTNLPPSIMYKGIRQKKIKINRKRTEQDYRLKEGDVLQLFLPEEFFIKEAAGSSFLHLKPDISVLYEDRHILLVNKKPGMVVHSDDKQDSGTLIDHIKAHLIQTGEYQPEKEQSFVPALCNRIDRNTGGIVLAAKDAESLRILNDQIRQGGLDKRYLAAAHGIFEKKSGRLEGYLIKDGQNNLVKVYDRKPRTGDAKKIITEYQVLKEKEELSLLEVHLLTGRTHQIRAHMAHIGHPLLGDGKYGSGRDDERKGYRFQALYSYKLRFSFVGDAGILSDLDGREFCVSPEGIFFLSLFKEE